VPGVARRFINFINHKLKFPWNLKKLILKENVSFLGFVTGGYGKYFQPIRFSRLAVQREHIYECFVVLYRYLKNSI